VFDGILMTDSVKDRLHGMFVTLTIGE